MILSLQKILDIMKWLELHDKSESLYLVANGERYEIDKTEFEKAVKAMKGVSA